MIKHCLMFVALFLGIQAASAQMLTYGSLDVLKDEKSVNVVVDYSEAIIMDCTESEFAEWEDDWDKDQPIIMKDFLEEVNQRSGKILLVGCHIESNYTFRWAVKSIDYNGAILSDFYLERKDGTVVATIEDVEGRGGAFGTKLYLIKSGAESTGRTFGRFIKQQLK